MEARRLEGHITDPRNEMMEEASRRQRRMKLSSEGCQGQEGAVTPCMEWNGIEHISKFEVQKCSGHFVKQ
jgi:hypothetical protein